MLQPQQTLHQRYQLQRKLGQNAGRQTWLATDITTEPMESVTLKLLAFNPQMQWEDLKLFEREAQVLNQLQHPRIPQYRDYFSLDKQAGSGLPWFGLVQDYIPGTSLQQRLDQGMRWTEPQLRQIAIEVLEILVYLHGITPPVLHRDIKPSNLIWGDDENIYLVDFGAVQDQTAAEGVTFTVVGTTGYAPLEQFWGKAVPASDLYALGATLIHLATGIPPADLPQRQMRVQFRDRLSLNSTFVRWLEVLTEPDLEQRYGEASEALADLKTNQVRRTSLTPTRQPLNSQIQIKTSTQRLVIKIPARGVVFRTAMKLGMGRILRTSLPLLLLLLVIIILNLLVTYLPATFIQANPIFFPLLGLTVLLTWIGTIEARILKRLEPEQDRIKLAKSGLKLIVIASLGLLFGVMGYGLIIAQALSTFMRGDVTFFLWLAIAIICGWFLIRFPTKLIKTPNPLRFTLLGHHQISMDRNNFTLKRWLLGICYDSQKIYTSGIQTIKSIAFKEITIQTQSDHLTFGQELTQAERDWLVQEIEAFINDKS